MKLNLTLEEAAMLEELEEPSVNAPSTNHITGPERLLILEDDLCYTKILENQVMREWPGCQITAVSDKPEFVAALENRTYDLILSDYCLPHFSGVAALAIIRAHYAKIPFIFVSGAIGDDVGVECLKQGATDFIMKGRLTRLIPAIERALEEARKNRERELVAAQLEQSNRQYQSLVNAVDGIVWQADQASMQFIFVSRQAERLLGHPVEWWVEKKNFWRELIHAEDREKVDASYRYLTLEQGRCQVEYRVVAADGRTVWLRDNVSLTAQADGRLQLQGIMVDATQQKEAEAEINSIQARLQESNEDLTQKNEEIQNFYHTLSHELKTPLTSAREFVSLVMEGVAGPLTETQNEYLGIAKKSCDQLRLCVNDLLDATRVETGKMSLELKPASLTALANRVVTALKPQAAERDIRLNLEVPGELLEISMDEHRIAQTITNLLNNALNHTPRGGKITVQVQEVPGRRDFVQVSVCDTGCGIAKEELERIFNRLYQIKTGDATSKNGIGLGLYLCKELVDLHGGEIWVESEVDRGSQFKFILPKSQLLFRPNVLVIDDDPDILEMTCNALMDAYNVRRATHGEEGMAELQRQLPDVVLLDLSMPNMDGVEVLKQIRRNWSNVQVIVHTAYTSGELMKQAMEYSPFTLLSKPSGIIQLRDTVRNVLRLMDTTISNRRQTIVKTAAAK